MNAPCELLPWDSEFFGLRIARATGGALGSDGRRAALNFCRAERVDCLYVLVDAAAQDAIDQFAAAPFRLVDLRVTFARTLAPTDGAPRDAVSRPAVADDLPALEAIARTGHADSRFYADGRFPRERCDALYATWIRRSVEGWANQVLVADHDGRPAGYISCHVEDGVGRIGLIAVAESARGHGLGPALVHGAMAWFAEQRCTAVTVVTQGRNASAQRLYQRSGFVTDSLGLWFHAWFGPARSSAT